MRESSHIVLSRKLIESFGRLPAEIADRLRYWIEHNLQLEEVNPRYCRIHQGALYINLTNQFLANYLFCTTSAAGKATNKLIKAGLFIPGEFENKYTGGHWVAFDLAWAKSLDNFFDRSSLQRLESIHTAENGSYSNGTTEAEKPDSVVPLEQVSCSNGTENSYSNGTTSIIYKGLTKDNYNNARARVAGGCGGELDLSFLNADELADYGPHLLHISQTFKGYDPLALTRAAWQYLKTEIGLGQRRVTISETEVLNFFKQYGETRMMACLVAIAFNGTGNASPNAIRGFMPNIGKAKPQRGASPAPPKRSAGQPRPTYRPAAKRTGGARPVSEILGASFLDPNVKPEQFADQPAR